MERSPADGLERDDLAEETTHSGADWPVPEPYRIGTEAPPSVTDSGTPTILPAPALSGRRVPLGRTGIPVAAALALGAVIATFLATSPSEPASEAGGTSTGAMLGGATDPAPRDQSPVVPASHHPAATEVPDVEGTPVAAARRALREAGLKAQTRPAESDHPDGVVLAQEPGADERAARGSIVVLVVSSGPPSVAVPDLVGQRADRAGRLVRREGLRVEIRFVRSLEQAGIVVEQRPTGGSPLRRGGVVVLTVAESHSEAATLRVPRLEGLRLAEAKARLRARGLRWSVEEVPSSRPQGVVVGQSEPSAAVVEKGTRVTLQVSSGPLLEAVPDVVGLDVVLARQQLEEAGFVVLVTESPTTDPGEEGIVLDQSPGSGSRLAEGSEVTLVVGIAG